MAAACHHFISQDSWEELQSDIREHHRLRGLRARNRGYLYQVIALGGALGCFRTCTVWAISANFLDDTDYRAYTTPASSLGDELHEHISTLALTVTTCSTPAAEFSIGDDFLDLGADL
eukprot:GHVU01049502.1.p1 GENE.GHVU01049502.1~~GHVU01049502.1.p1  ORF type:complete len:118 (+),score=5.45 GHVU01049502.1:316-669(+)